MKCRFRPTFLRALLLLTAQFLLAGVIRYFLSIPIYRRSVIEVLFVLVLILSIFKDAFWKRAVVASSLIVIIAITEFATKVLLMVIGGGAYTLQEESEEILITGWVIWAFIAYTLTMAFIVLYRILIHKIKVWSMFLYVAVPIYQVVMLFMYYYNCQKYSNQVIVYGVSYLVLGLCMDFLIIYFQRTMEKNQDTKTRLEAINKQREYELAYYRQVNQSMEQMRAVRHDFMNQIQTARRMVQTRQERDKIEKLLKESEKRLRNACPGTGDLTVAFDAGRKEERTDERL